MKILEELPRIKVNRRWQIRLRTDEGDFTCQELMEILGWKKGTFYSRAKEPGGYLSPRFLRPLVKRAPRIPGSKESMRKRIRTYVRVVDRPGRKPRWRPPGAKEEVVPHPQRPLPEIQGPRPKLTLHKVADKRTLTPEEKELELKKRDAEYKKQLAHCYRSGNMHRACNGSADHDVVMKTIGD